MQTFITDLQCHTATYSVILIQDDTRHVLVHDVRFVINCKNNVYRHLAWLIHQNHRIYEISDKLFIGFVRFIPSILDLSATADASNMGAVWNRTHPINTIYRPSPGAWNAWKYAWYKTPQLYFWWPEQLVLQRASLRSLECWLLCMCVCVTKCCRYKIWGKNSQGFEQTCDFGT